MHASQSTCMRHKGHACVTKNMHSTHTAHFITYPNEVLEHIAPAFVNNHSYCQIPQQVRGNCLNGVDVAILCLCECVCV